MSDYADLIKALRACNAPGGFCDSCPYHYGGIPCLDLNKNAADAIESMQAQMPKRGKLVKCEAAEYAWCCSECGHGYTDNKLTYCYDCGAKMEA